MISPRSHYRFLNGVYLVPIHKKYISLVRVGRNYLIEAWFHIWDLCRISGLATWGKHVWNPCAIFFGRHFTATQDKFTHSWRHRLNVDGCCSFFTSLQLAIPRLDITLELLQGRHVRSTLVGERGWLFWLSIASDMGSAATVFDPSIQFVHEMHIAKRVLPMSEVQ